MEKITDAAEKITDAAENHVGTCGATVIDDVYERDAAGRVKFNKKRRAVVVGRERHQCSSMNPEACAAAGKHRCSHGRGWADHKSEPRDLA